MSLRARSPVADLEIELHPIVTQVATHHHQIIISKAIMPTVTKLLYQNVMQVDSGQLSAHIISESNLIEEQHQLRSLLDRNEGRALGLAGGFAPTGELAMLAIADKSTIVIIEFESKKSKGNEHDERAARVFLTQNLLRRTTGFLYAFDIAPIALALSQTLDLRIANAIDVQCAGSKTRIPLAVVKQAVGDLHDIYDQNINEVFRDNTILDHPLAAKNGTTSLAQRAWIAHYLSQLSTMEDRFAQVPPVDTFRLSDEALEFLAKSSKDSFRLEQKKPTEVTRRFATSVDHQNNHINAKVDRYQNKIRKGQRQACRLCVYAVPCLTTNFPSVRSLILASTGGRASLSTDRLLSLRVAMRNWLPATLSVSLTRSSARLRLLVVMTLRRLRSSVLRRF
ncbi:hypothetical protein BDR04DRAFT_202823 [Suillus decipiens]|nr:hypothetical protein BDR04DRAFT_202823 [Suillus decipiens]